MTKNPHTADMLAAIWSLAFQTLMSVLLVVMAFRGDVAWCVATGFLLLSSVLSDMRRESYR